MTKTIEQLQARVRELEEENKQLEDDCGYQMQWKREFSEQLEYSQKQLSAAQLQIKQLQNWILTNSMHADDCDVIGLDEDGLHCACSCGLTETLSTPISTEALDAYVAEKVKEETDRLLQISPELRKAMGDSQVALWMGYCDKKIEVEYLTRQRDLAVEALEWIASSLPQIGVERVWMLDHAIKTLLAAIKESEK